MRKNLLNLFGLGKTPFAASTASLAGLMMYVMISYSGLYALYFHFFFFIAVILWTYRSMNNIQYNYEDDPREIVIDEFLGMYIMLICAGTSAPSHLLILFIAFRFYDIYKFPPISTIDNIKHKYAIVADDVLLGIILGLIYRLFLFLLP